MATTPTIAARIALEGAEEIKKQLDDLGAAGVKAYTDIQKAADKAGGFDKLDPTEVTKKLEKLGLTAPDAFNKIQKAVGDTAKLEKWVGVVATLETAFSKLGKGAIAVGRAFGPLGVAVAAVGTAFTQATSGAQNLINAMNNLAVAGNVPIQRYDTLRRLANEAGISTEQFAKIMGTFNEELAKPKADKLEELRKSADELKAAGWGDKAIFDWLNRQAGELDRVKDSGGSAAGQLRVFLEHLKSLPTDAQRAAAVQRQFGESNQVLVDSLVKLANSADLTKTSVNALSAADAAAAIAAEQAANRRSAAWNNLMLTIGKTGIGPTIDNMLTGVFFLLDQGIQIIAAGISKAGTLIGQSVEGWEIMFTGLWDFLKPFGGLDQAVAQIFSNIGQTIQGWWSALKTGAADAWGSFTKDGSSAIGTVIGGIQTMIGWLQTAWNWVKKVFSGGAAAPTSEAGGMARGGAVRGRGTSTSDSILARLSTGEFVMSAKAVKHFGSQFFAALNALRTPHGFSTGGIVRRHMAAVRPPRFADGGLVGAGRNLGTLTLNLGGQSVKVLASPSAVEQLSRFATISGQRRAGRPPGWA